MKKVLLVLPSLTQSNGISAFIFNYLEKIPVDLNIQFTILSGNLRPSENYINKCKELNIPLYFLPNISTEGLKSYLKELKNFFNKHHDYDAVYSHTANQSLFIFHYAKKYGINNRFIHSHATESAADLVKKIRNNILIALTLKKATQYFACSEAAGEALFKNKKYYVIHNAVDYDSLKFNEEKRNKIRAFYSIGEKKVVGFVGRLVSQKNIFFLIDIAKQLPEEFVFMIIGTGVLKDSFEKRIKEEDLEGRFLLLGEISDVNSMYSAMDYFVLPSFYEGLPVVGIEAQANGLMCLFSNKITNELKISDYCYFLEIESAEKWASFLKNNQNNTRLIKLSDKYNIKVQANKFGQLLINLIK